MATLLLLSVVCVYTPELPIGEVAGQWYWLAQTAILYTITLVIAVLLYPDRKRSPFPEYYYIIIWSLIILTGVQGFWGLSQLLFSEPVTGSFHNEELYAGFLAMIFPLCVNEWLQIRERRKMDIFQKARYYISLLVLTLILIVLLSEGIFAAWFAVIFSTVFVMWHHFGWRRELKNVRQVDKKKALRYSMAAVLGCLIIVGAGFLFNRENAERQLFLTKISLKVISENPVSGYGPKGFPNAYGKAQESYFASGEISPEEEVLATNPVYPSNEYIHGAIKWGIPILLCVLIFVGLSVREGVKQGRISACAGVISLLVFAFFSYPMQIPAFVISFLFLVVACIIGRQRMWLVGLAFIIGMFGFHWWRMDDYHLCKEWSMYQKLYQVAAYDAARNGYQQLYPQLREKPEFLSEYGHCLYMLGDYEESINILNEASLYSCDPMIYNNIGRNYQMLGNYEEAERWYTKSTNLSPGKMYPYYLLARLYDEPGFRQPEKCKEMAQRVLEKEKDDDSLIARQMREEARSLSEMIDATQ